MNKISDSTRLNNDSVLFLVLFILCLLGLIFRFAFVWEVGHHASLNIYLAQTDMYNYDLMARDLLRSNPLGLRMIGYPLFIRYLKLFYEFIGTSPLAFYIHNFILSLVSTFLLYRIGSMHWGWLAGMLGALMFIFYKMNYLYDALRFHTVFSQLLHITTLYFFFSFRKNNSIISYAGFMASGIVLSLIRIFFGFIFVLGIGHLFFTGQQWRSKACCCIIAVSCILGVVGFNRLHSTDTYSHKFGVHFYIGNHADTMGLFTPIKGVRTHAQGLAQDTILEACEETGTAENINTYWINKTFDSYKDSPRKVFEVLGRKINLFTNNYEPHNNASIYFYEKKTALTYYPRLDYAVIFAFAILGMITTLKKKQEARFLILPTILIVVMIFSVFFCSRYRLPVIPFLCLFAGCGIDQIVQFVKGKDYRGLIVGGIIVGLLLFWSYHTIPILNKGQDVHFWEARDASRIHTNQQRQEALRQYRNWTNLDSREKITLAGQLGEVGLIHEFFDVFDEAGKLAANMNDRQSLVYLLSVKASLHEEAFQLKEALKMWQDLKAYKSIEKIASQKIRALEIAGAVLDPDLH